MVRMVVDHRNAGHEAKTPFDVGFYRDVLYWDLHHFLSNQNPELNSRVVDVRTCKTHTDS